MPDLKELLTAYVDDGAPPVTADESRSCARRHTRKRAVAATVIVSIVLAASLVYAVQITPARRGVVSTATTVPLTRWRPTLHDVDGEIHIPAINVNNFFVEGMGTADLRRGPGHDPHSSLPGQPGTVVIDGHRTTYGAPFYNLDQLRPGDRITIVMPYGTFQYKVRNHVVILPTEIGAVTRSHAALALVTQQPKYSKSHRLVVFADAG
jgi:LPXTG-site transpeptidase (sortase) family protein